MPPSPASFAFAFAALALLVDDAPAGGSAGGTVGAVGPGGTVPGTGRLVGRGATAGGMVRDVLLGLAHTVSMACVKV